MQVAFFLLVLAPVLLIVVPLTVAHVRERRRRMTPRGRPGRD